MRTTEIHMDAVEESWREASRGEEGRCWRGSGDAAEETVFSVFSLSLCVLTHVSTPHSNPQSPFFQFQFDGRDFLERSDLFEAGAELKRGFGTYSGRADWRFEGEAMKSLRVKMRLEGVELVANS